MKIVIKKLFTLMLFACCLQTDVTAAEPALNHRAKNIILIIGDGMGAEHRKAARWASVGRSGRLVMEDMPARAMVHTRSANRAITDSAAAMTAMATGTKTNNGVIAMDAHLKPVTTILEQARKLGKSTGLVTTTQITHATPAALVAHIHNRNLMTRIAQQMIDAGVDVLLGGGEDEFLPLTQTGCFPNKGKRRGGRNLIQEAVGRGYSYICNAESLALGEKSSRSKLLGLFADEGMTRPFEPNLADMTRKAIDILSTDPDGFFLMVEGGQIDWASHHNDAANAIADTIGLDAAVEAARQFASRKDDTLLIVTADHETGGMRVSSRSSGLPGEQGPFHMPDGGQFTVRWSTEGHTPVDVPLTSFGPLSERFTGVVDNTYIYQVMSAAIGDGTNGVQR